MLINYYGTNTHLMALFYDKYHIKMATLFIFFGFLLKHLSLHISYQRYQ